MNRSILQALGALAMLAPFLTIFGLFIYYFLLRVNFRRRRRRGKRFSGTYPSTFALGMAFQFLQVFYQPTTAFEIQAKLVEDVEEDDQGDPETPEKHLHRQLRRIRRGEQIDTLVLRL